MKSTEQECADFEAHFKHLDLTQEPDAWGVPRYKHVSISLAWQAWQAARRAQVLPEPCFEWVDPAPPTGSPCFYHHVTAQSPLGEYSIEWKSWKPVGSFCLYLNGEYLQSLPCLDAAKAFARQHLAELACKLQAFAAAPQPPEA